MRIVIYGAGAIGASVGGWLAEAGHTVTFLARPENAKALNEEGLCLHLAGQKAALRRIPIRAVSDLGEAGATEVLVLAVKNYDLDATAREIKAKMDREPIVVALQNGLENQSILPRYFARVVYGVVCFNAWRDAPNVVGYQDKGPIMLGVLDDALVADRDRLVRAFARAFECRAEPRLTDAVKCKMLINLANSVTALVGLGVRPIEDFAAMRKCIAHVLYEGMQVLQRAGVREVPLANAPNWRVIKASVGLPAFVADRIFARNLKKVRMSSMGQDVYMLKRGATELESLNGYFVRLADSVGFDARYNRRLYAITREWLAQPDIRPMHEAELWARLDQA